MKDLKLEIPALQELVSKLEAIEQKLDAINKPNPLEGKWLTKLEAAKIIGCCTKTLDSIVARGEIRMSADGRRRRIPAEDVQLYLNRGMEGGKNEI